MKNLLMWLIRKHRWSALFCIELILILASEVVLAEEAKAGWKSDWEKTVKMAEEEGRLNLYVFSEGPVTFETLEAFQKAYPKIKVISVKGRGSQLVLRVMAERRAEKYLADVYTGGKSSVYSVLYRGKALDPIKPHFILPEVADQSKWWDGKHKYVDPEGKYIFAFMGNGGATAVNYNTKLASPKEFSSLRNLLNPKWKGKIVSMDPRVRGSFSTNLLFYYHPKFGPEFIRQFYGGMDVTFSRDRRQAVNWLATGKFALCVPCTSDEIDRAIKQGLPIAVYRAMDEAARMTSAGGTLNLMNRAPHPNAARVFINWLLSRKGQILAQKPGSNSLRTDIPKEDVDRDNLRVKGLDYFDSDNPKNSNPRPVVKLIRKVAGAKVGSQR